MNYFRSDGFYGDFYHEALLFDFHGSGDGDDYSDKTGTIPEMNDVFFCFTSEDASDFDRSGDLNAS